MCGQRGCSHSSDTDQGERMRAGPWWVPGAPARAQSHGVGTRSSQQCCLCGMQEVPTTSQPALPLPFLLLQNLLHRVNKQDQHEIITLPGALPLDGTGSPLVYPSLSSAGGCGFRLRTRGSLAELRPALPSPHRDPPGPNRPLLGHSQPEQSR